MIGATAEAVEVVIREVARAFGLTRQQVTGRSQAPHVTAARCLAMVLCGTHTNATMEQVGQRFAGRSRQAVATISSAYGRHFAGDADGFKAKARIASLAIQEALR